MSYVLTCPNCGPREVTDFGFGGEVNPRPKSRPGKRELGAYNYFRRNVAAVQREWWVHRSVLLVELPGERPSISGDGGPPGAGAGGE